MTPYPIVYLVDVDNTLLDNDGIQQDLKTISSVPMAAPRACATGRSSRTCSESWDIATTSEPSSATGWSTRAKWSCCRCPPSSSTIRSPKRLFPAALECCSGCAPCGPTVILSDGDVVFQPRKVSVRVCGDAVDGHVLIYIHKEEALDDVERRYPADHYVLVDDKLRILTAVKQFWGERVTTVFARQGTLCPRRAGAQRPCRRRT